MDPCILILFDDDIISAEQQAQIREKLKSLVGNNPIESIRDMARQNRKKLKSIRQEIIEEIDKLTRRSDD